MQATLTPPRYDVYTEVIGELHPMYLDAGYCMECLSEYDTRNAPHMCGLNTPTTGIVIHITRKPLVAGMRNTDTDFDSLDDLPF